MARTSTTVIPLRSRDARRLSLVGGKAANLAELIAAGFTVPGGFCVATPAYAQAAAAADLDGVLDATTGDVAARARRARAALLAVPLPGDVAEAITTAYAALGDDVPVAVRSSATAEDLPTASFAGQQDTYLNVIGTDALLDAVRRCWASLWTDRAVAYRADAGIDDRAVQLAVVVQEMVDVAVAGVLFTADPVSGRRTRTVIDAAPGLGEAVVSGAVNPDHIVVEGDGTIAEHRLGDKAVLVRALPGGGTEQMATTAGAGEPSLTEGRIRELVALGRRVEAHYGIPQDIEWAFDTDGVAWLTQSRPITTLYPLPAPAGPGLRVFLCISLAQGLTRPMTPMGLSAFRLITAAGAAEGFGLQVADPHAGAPAFTTAGGRAFLDFTPALRNRAGRAIIPRVLNVMETRSAVVVRGLLTEPAFAVRTGWWPFLRRVLRVVVRYRVPPLLALSLLRPAAGRRRVARVGDRLRQIARSPRDVTPVQRLDRVERVLGQVFPIMPRVTPVAGAGFLMLGLAQRLGGPDLDVHEVLRSLPHNSTTGMDLELWALATRIRADADAAATLQDRPTDELTARYHRGALPPVLQHGLGDFLRVHGHRAVAEIDLGMPRWSDDPAYVLGVLANYLRLSDPAQAPDAVFARGQTAADAAIAQAVAAVRRRSPLRARLLGAALRRMRELAGMREEHKDFLVLLLAHARSEMAILGGELTAAGLLAAADDVFFLELTELRSALAGADHRVTVAERREEYRRELRRRHVPRILLSDGTEPEALAVATDVEGALVGTPASAGTITAPARVVLDPVGARLEPGEILVAPSTDPGWTPLFLTAGGLVMEMGGPNSHGAVVAREYGIPAVVGVSDATVRIRTGDMITVDGAAGLVRPEPPALPPDDAAATSLPGGAAVPSGG